MSDTVVESGILIKVLCCHRRTSYIIPKLCPQRKCNNWKTRWDQSLGVSSTTRKPRSPESVSPLRLFVWYTRYQSSPCHSGVVLSTRSPVKMKAILIIDQLLIRRYESTRRLVFTISPDPHLCWPGPDEELKYKKTFALPRREISRHQSLFTMRASILADDKEILSWKDGCFSTYSIRRKPYG